MHCKRRLHIWCRQPEAHVEALGKQSEVAPHVQDDFDIPEEALKELDPRDQQENQVHMPKARPFDSKGCELKV